MRFQTPNLNWVVGRKLKLLNLNFSRKNLFQIEHTSLNFQKRMKELMKETNVKTISIISLTRKKVIRSRRFIKGRLTDYHIAHLWWRDIQKFTHISVIDAEVKYVKANLVNAFMNTFLLARMKWSRKSYEKILEKKLIFCAQRRS